MTTIYIETLGCAKNRVDSEIMLGILNANSFAYTPDPEKAEVIILNTCAFLTSAVKESIDRILALSEYKETAQCLSLIVVGCLSERYREELLNEIPEIDGILGTSDYTKILSCVRSSLEETERRSYLADSKPRYSMSNFEAVRLISTERSHAYLKISEGCSNMCSFCNIPFLRGAFSSRPIAHVVKDFKNMLETGIKEINIISQDSSSYGSDLPKDNNLKNLIQSLLDADSSEFWLRVFYSYPNRYPTELFQLMSQDSRLTKYVDMPFQHISDQVLKDMNRRISRNKIEKLLETALNIVPDIAFRTTFIVGFPTETDENFNELLQFVEQGWFQHIGVFCYSHEDNIRSKKFGDPIPQEIKEERRKLIMEAQQTVSLKKNLALIGTTMKVLVKGLSSETDLLLEGRSQFQGVDVDGVVYINEGDADAHKFTEVVITDAHPYDLIGSVLHPENTRPLSASSLNILEKNTPISSSTISQS